MDVKQYLSQYRTIYRTVKIKQDQIEMLRSLLLTMSPDYSAERVRSIPARDRTGEIIAKVQEDIADLCEDIGRLIDVGREIRGVIYAVHDVRYRNLLELRYLNVKTWEQIGELMHYDPRWVRRMHGRALQAASKVMVDPVKPTL